MEFCGKRQSIERSECMCKRTKKTDTGAQSVFTCFASALILTELENSDLQKLNLIVIRGKTKGCIAMDAPGEA